LYCHLSATLQTMVIIVVNLQDKRAVFQIFIALLSFSFDFPSYIGKFCALWYLSYPFDVSEFLLSVDITVLWYLLASCMHESSCVCLHLVMHIVINKGISNILNMLRMYFYNICTTRTGCLWCIIFQTVQNTVF
jgi:hypothetical protein